MFVCILFPSRPGHGQIQRRSRFDQSVDNIQWFIGSVWLLFIKLLHVLFHLLNLLMVEAQSALNIRGTLLLSDNLYQHDIEM